MAGAGERTEEPTQKKLDDARRKGQVAQSRDLTQAAALTAALAAFMATASHLAGQLVSLVSRALHRAQTPSDAYAVDMLADGLETALVASLPVLLATLVVAMLVAFLQTKGVFSTEPLSPKLERLDPFAGLKRLFSIRSLVETAKALVKLAAVFVVAYAALKDRVGDLARLPEAPPAAALDLTIALATRVAWSVAVVFAAVALLDALYQRWQHRRELRMTKQEVKDEHKSSEGDPQHKADRQRMHKEIAGRAMLADVRRAKVVVVNPEHIAVALTYDDEEGSDTAPRIIAKGEEWLAHEIIAVAREAGVPVVRNVPLAQALNRLELGEEIPEALYEAAAEVLQFVASLAEGRRE